MISYDEAGTGPAVVLLHSTVCDRQMWDPLWPVLVDAGYRLVRCDFRGFGATPVPAAPYNDADDVMGLVGELDVGPVALVGASYGGKVALEIAADGRGRSPPWRWYAPSCQGMSRRMCSAVSGSGRKS
jgi:3-oxoadipate enol-lactonase